MAVGASGLGLSVVKGESVRAITVAMSGGGAGSLAVRSKGMSARAGPWLEGGGLAGVSSPVLSPALGEGVHGSAFGG